VRGHWAATARTLPGTGSAMPEKSGVEMHVQRRDRNGTQSLDLGVCIRLSL